MCAGGLAGKVCVYVGGGGEGSWKGRWLCVWGGGKGRWEGKWVMGGRVQCGSEWVPGKVSVCVCVCRGRGSREGKWVGEYGG